MDCPSREVQKDPFVSNFSKYFAIFISHDGRAKNTSNRMNRSWKKSKSLFFGQPDDDLAHMARSWKGVKGNIMP